MKTSEIISLAFRLREERLILQRQVDALEQEEKDLNYELTKRMRDEKAQYMRELGFVAELNKKQTPFVTSWPSTLLFVKETGALDLLQKRLTESAVKARWEAGVDIPGVDKLDKYSVTITKDQS